MDPQGEDLPSDRKSKIRDQIIEIRAMNTTQVWKSKHLQEKREECEQEALEMAKAEEWVNPKHKVTAK
jgi:hypothetical protein